MKSSLKRGDVVVIISGDDKGKTGKIVKILREKNRVVVEGVAVAKKHTRKSQEYPEGSIIEKLMSIHISNVALKLSNNEIKNNKKEEQNA
jgi:large subunit ribosomal protein L24